MVGKQGIKGFTHRLFGRSKAGTLRIGGITHQGKYTFFADFRKTLQVDSIAEYRCVVHLKVAGVHHNTRRGINGKGCRIHDTVVRLDKFDTELSQIDGLTEFNNLSLGALL